MPDSQDNMTPNFGGSQLKPEYTAFKKARIVVLQCPYEETASYKKGTVRGPEAVIKASEYMEVYDEELKQETYKAGIHTMPPLALGGLAPEQMVRKVAQEVRGIITEQKIPVIIGGEHSVSIGAVQAAGKFFKDLSVLHLDAHHDLRDEYEGSKFNHACAARRFLETAPVTQAVTRSLSKEEQDFIGTRPEGLKIFSAYDIIETAIWKENVAASLTDNVYVSLDMDAMDPSVMPSVGTPEPGGIGWYELLDLLKIVAKTKKIIGFDVVELMPIDGFVAPDFLTAKLIYRLMGYILQGKSD
ncbi:MAG: agmatinase [Candidatus Omnitrophota bacterium]